MFEKHSFWELVDEYSGKLLSIDFEFITPNMATISSALSGDLKKLAKSTNSIRNRLRLESGESASLAQDQSNQMINGLVDYSGQGGGDITLKIKGLKKKVKTSKTLKEVEFDEIDLEGDPETVVAMLKNILP